jgi:hypothetical protein
MGEWIGGIPVVIRFKQSFAWNKTEQSKRGNKIHHNKRDQNRSKDLRRNKFETKEKESKLFFQVK